MGLHTFFFSKLLVLMEIRIKGAWLLSSFCRSGEIMCRLLKNPFLTTGANLFPHPVSEPSHWFLFPFFYPVLGLSCNLNSLFQLVLIHYLSPVSIVHEKES